MVSRSAWSRRKRVKILFLCAALVLPWAPQGIAEETTGGQSNRWIGVTIEPSRRIHVPGFRWDHEVRIALPQGYSTSKKSYPVLWVTDGSMLFDEAVTTVNVWNRSNIPQMIIVGIGMPHLDKHELAEYEMRRIYDFFPSRPAAEQGSKFWEAYEKGLAEKGFPLTYGGARAFLSFMVDRLRPSLAHDYRMSDQNVLFGYSAGGAFCEYALLTRTEAFQRYICGGGEALEVRSVEAGYARSHDDLAARVYLGYADKDVIGGAPSLPALLQSRKYPSLGLDVHIFPDEDHGTAIPLVMSHGLRFVWQGAPPPDSLELYR